MCTHAFSATVHVFLVWFIPVLISDWHAQQEHEDSKRRISKLEDALQEAIQARQKAETEMEALSASIAGQLEECKAAKLAVDNRERLVKEREIWVDEADKLLLHKSREFNLKISEYNQRVWLPLLYYVLSHPPAYV